MITRRRFLTLTAMLLTDPAAAMTVPVRWRARALGADAEITLYGPRIWAGDVLKHAERELVEIERLFNLFDPASSLSRLNRQGALVETDPRFHHLLAAVDRMHHATGGLFDPTVQPLWRALADGRGVSRARGLIGWSRIRREAARVRLAPGQEVTFNGIAQGYATDRIRALLKRKGAAEVLVNIGEFAALGGPWRLGVSDPLHGLVTTRTLTGLALATSSPGALKLAGRETHILNPAGGKPVWSTVSVEATSATIADGLSTALCHADLGSVRRIVSRLPGVRRITLIDPDGDLVTIRT
ncbi:FAD:protein FMN transferase [Roseibium sp. Sym1]|uniref:FAD:protein FMN transferase n=1 Tax=Roseibium sp. Sym1 TaxID=3016006 RepID=UPI0022B4DF56|nr:FAD:protein FMN transferase [Roseibium sp. Sym1]